MPRTHFAHALGGSALTSILWALSESVQAQAPAPTSSPTPTAPTVASVLAGASAEDWRPLDPENTLYLELATGRVVIELAPAFAPAHVGNVKALVREGYFDGLTINRVQDNYVAQWGDGNGSDPALRREIKKARKSLPAEFDQAMGPDMPFALSPDGDISSTALPPTAP